MFEFAQHQDGTLEALDEMSDREIEWCDFNIVEIDESVLKRITYDEITDEYVIIDENGITIERCPDISSAITESLSLQVCRGGDGV